jgi:DnaK suppressor protein
MQAPESEEKTVSKTPAPKTAAAPKGAKTGAKTDAGADVAMLEAPAPANRFADRFAPPKPPVRGANHTEETLTDAEVLAMPDSEYMNAKQIEFFRAKLNALKDGVLSNAGETTEHLREDTTIVPDPADRATIEEEHALELRTRDRERKLLKKIVQSIARLDSGEYGYCDETGEPIGLGRLIARPTATLSLEAQQRRELKQKMFGD